MGGWDGEWLGIENEMNANLSSQPEWHIHRVPGNQVPTKCVSSSKCFGRIHALSQIDKFNQRM